MRPDESQQLPSTTPPTQPQSSTVNNLSVSPQQTEQEAASNIVRAQINNLYQNDASQQSTDSTVNPYYRSHSSQPQSTQEQLKHYHSSWQTYYQTYYERYYTHRVQEATHAIAAHTNAAQPEQPTNETIDKDEALFELRNQLVGNVQATATKVKKSRHFVPFASAICVMILFLFLQYNRVLFANVQAYVSPGSIDPQNIIVDPTVSTKVDPSSTKLIIPKINVDVPVDYSATPDHNSQMAAMANGVAFFGISGANSKPGQVGNLPIAGHSSNDVIDAGNYKFIFAQLDKLKKGDTIYAHYKGTRYTYVVTRTEVVVPSEINKLVYKTDKPVLTLITCTPLGTALKRLLVTAEQVSPSPTGATTAPKGSGEASQTKTEMPGNSPTFVERLFGAQ